MYNAGAQALISNTTMTEVAMSENLISDAQASLITNAICKNRMFDAGIVVNVSSDLNMRKPPRRGETSEASRGLRTQGFFPVSVSEGSATPSLNNSLS